jgi:RNA polymerase sigma factor (sigma-70 family)
MASRAKVNPGIVRALTKVITSELSDGDLLARFASSRDQAAFAALVARHTDMVLGVCRRALANTPDAEDVCQAVFLLLAEKAGSIRCQASVAGWLYTTARKVAQNARVAAERRARRERKAAVPETVPVLDTIIGRELVAILDEELDWLPHRYREPLVLCYLEGLTQDEAAQRLCVAHETLKSQLKRGRKKLSEALRARGYELGLMFLTTATVADAAASRPLRESILAAALGSPSQTAAALARRTTMIGFTATLKTRLLAAVGLVAAMALGIACALPTPPRPQTGEARQPVEQPREPAMRRFGATKFRATQRIGDARYADGGKQIVGFGGNTLYVWDARDGSLIRTIETQLAPLVDLAEEDRERAFAVHPRKSLVAWAGLRAGQKRLQLWNFQTGKLHAEVAFTGDTLKCLAWTPGGEYLLGRSNSGPWDKPNSWKLYVRDDRLKLIHDYDLPPKFGTFATVMQPLPGGKQVMLWQSQREPTVFDLEKGTVVRTLPHKPGLPSDLAVSPDGKTVVATDSNGICLFDLSDGKMLRELPVHRGGWYKPRPLFSPDGKTVYVWDHKPMAYDVATGKEKWRATPRTFHTVRMELCDLSPDGTTLLLRCGQALSLLDAASGAERNRAESPATPAGIVWSPDGTKLFTRRTRTDRTWTAWDGTSGKRLYDLQPTGFIANQDWKMLPDLFFVNGGKEIAACLEKSESTERSGPKEFFVFNAASGECLRRLGQPLPSKLFQWMHPIGVDPSGKSVTMQCYAISVGGAGPGAGGAFVPSREYTYATLRWDPQKQAKLQEWEVMGYRTNDPRHYLPYYVTLGVHSPYVSQKDKKPDPAKIRCYSLTDGKLVHEMTTEFTGLETDRIEGPFLLACGYDSNWIKRGNTHSYRPRAPFAYDLWELPSRQKVRVFEQSEKATVVLGPAGQYVVRVVDDHTCEIVEPFVLRKAVVRVTTPSQARYFEFSPDGQRVAASLADTTLAIWDTIPWRKQLNVHLAKAVPADITPLWEDLGREAPAGLRAARLLSVAGKRAVALLAKKVVLARAPDEPRIKRLITELDSENFQTREKAQKQLRELSAQAESSLRKELQTAPSAEARRRIKSLLQSIEEASLTREELRQLRAVQALQWMNNDDSQALLAKWAAGYPNAPLTRWARTATRR